MQWLKFEHLYLLCRKIATSQLFI